MEFGFCTNFATQGKYAIEWDVVELIREAGFDYVEFPLMTIAEMETEEYREFLDTYAGCGIPCRACSNMFPAHINLTGDAVDYSVIDDYLDVALARCGDMGVELLVFGSAGARNLPEGFPIERGMEQLRVLLKEHVSPKAAQYGILTVIEPIRPSDCNLVTTIGEGAELCGLVDADNILLLADSYQMDFQPAQLGELEEYLGVIRHIHISEADRIIPTRPVSDYVDAMLRLLARLGYNRRISLETGLGNGLPDVRESLSILKEYFIYSML